MRLKFREVTAFADAVTVLTCAKHVGGGKVVERVTALLLHHVSVDVLAVTLPLGRAICCPGGGQAPMS
jgi:hypothetical protein